MEKNKCCDSAEQYKVNIVYGEKTLFDCMVNVIRRLLVKSAENQKGQ